MNENGESARSKFSGPVQHWITITAGPDHIDMFAHVNNAWYIAWAMECAWAHSDALGLDLETYQRLGIGCIVREHRYTYYAPALEGDAVLVGTWVKSNNGKMRMTRGIEMRRLSDGKLLVAGETDFVSVSMKTGKPARMPPDYARLYAPPAEAMGREE